MSQKDYFQIDFQQEADVCLLASYGFVIEYYSRLAGVNKDSSIFTDLFKGYLPVGVDMIFLGFQLIEKDKLSHSNPDLYGVYCLLKNGGISINDVEDQCLQQACSSILHFYCQNLYPLIHPQRQDGLRGSEYIDKLNNAISQKGHTLGKLFIPDNFSLQVIPDNVKKDEVVEHITKNEHALAILVYPAAGKFHTVVCGCQDGKVFFRDPNNKGCSDTTYDNQTIESISIQECILVSFHP